MAPKRKVAAAKKTGSEANLLLNNETAKEKESVLSASQKQPSKKAKPEAPSSPVKTRGRPGKTFIPTEPKEVAKVQQTKEKNAKPPKEKSKDVKGEAVQPAAEVAEALKKDAESPVESSKLPKNIIIEHCKQCISFKTRAMKVKEHLEVKIQGVKVSINHEKPRKGCFEIRDEQGNIFVSLLNMPRPFTKLKELDLDTTIIDIIEKIK